MASTAWPITAQSAMPGFHSSTTAGSAVVFSQPGGSRNPKLLALCRARNIGTPEEARWRAASSEFTGVPEVV
jgi:molybdopterin biosynthesis enzyme